MLQTNLLPGMIEAGCDEAGRGCLCGPVACAAVILPSDFYHPLLNDSKQLSPKCRDLLRPIIEEQALAWAVVMVEPEEIDTVNILNASIIGMHRAVDALNIRPQHLLIDGNRFKPYPGIPHTTIVKGDATFMSIAAASILAKTHRDEIMLQYASRFPGYGWEKNMGYPTKEHLQGLESLGLTPIHRRSYAPCKKFIKTDN